MKLSCCGHIIGFAILLASGAASFGQTVPDAVYNGDAGRLTQFLHAPGTVFATAGSGTFVTMGNAPSLSIYAQATENSSYGMFAGATVDYYFEYTGPAGALPIDISYSLAYTDNYSASASAGVGLSVGGTGLDGHQLNYNGNGSQTVQGTLHDSLSTNTVYDITVSASIGPMSINSLGRTSSVSADPVISIDPSFAGDPSSYSLVLSNGVGNSAAPEPGVTVSVIMAGGLLLARRKRPSAL